MFTIGTGALLFGAVALAFRRRWTGASLLGLSLCLAGGLSNWVDRLAQGRVVDFLNVGVGTVRTGIFNIADVAVMLGAVILLLAHLRPSRNPVDAAEPEGISSDGLTLP